MVAWACARVAPFAGGAASSSVRAASGAGASGLSESTTAPDGAFAAPAASDPVSDSRSDTVFDPPASHTASNCKDGDASATEALRSVVSSVCCPNESTGATVSTGKVSDPVSDLPAGDGSSSDVASTTGAASTAGSTTGATVAGGGGA